MLPARATGRQIEVHWGGAAPDGRPAMARTAFRTCNLCEASCGLRFEVEDVERIVGQSILDGVPVRLRAAEH